VCFCPLIFLCFFTVIDAQLLSQAAIDNGTNITFPMEGNAIENILATSVVPAAALSNNCFKNCYANNSLVFRTISWSSD